MKNADAVLQDQVISKILEMIEGFWKFQRVSVSETECGCVTIQSRRAAYFDGYGKPSDLESWFQGSDEVNLTVKPADLPEVHRLWQPSDDSLNWEDIETESEVNHIVEYLENRTLKPIVLYLLRNGFGYLDSRWDDSHDVRDNPEVTLYLGANVSGKIKGVKLTIGAVDLR